MTATGSEKQQGSFLRPPHTWESLSKIQSNDEFWEALDFDNFNIQHQHGIEGDSEDFLQLRAALSKRLSSGFELHKRCFKAIQERVELKERNGCFSFDLVNNFIHAEPIGCFAISPCKGYIAVATRCGGNYDGGGSIQILEISTGRAVNQAYGGIEGGIGWSGHARMLQWIPEEKSKGILAYCYHTNGFGFCYPTDDMQHPEIECFPLEGRDEPCPFAYSQEGTFAIGYGYNEAETVPGGTTDGDDELEYFEEELPDHLKGEDGEAPSLGSWEYMMFTRDAKRLQGTTYDSAIAIDMETRQLIYVAEGVRGHSAWTEDGHLFAHSSPHLTIRNATTGEILREFPDYKGNSELSWTIVDGAQSNMTQNIAREQQLYRLAMVVGGKYDPNYSAQDEVVVGTLGSDVVENLQKAKRARLESKPAGVYVFDVSMNQQEFLCQLPTSTGFPTQNHFFADKNLWSWSPCGTMGAALDANAKVVVWQLLADADANGEVFQNLSEFSVSESTLAIAFGTDSSLVTIGENVLEFWNAQGGTLIRRIDRAQLAEAYAQLSPVGPSAMRVGDKDFGILDTYSSETKFSLLPILDQAGDAFNVCVVKKGALLCPSDKLEEAKKHCHFSFNSSHSWPLEWAEYKICESLRDLMNDPLFPLPEESREKVRLAAETPTTMPQVKTLVSKDTSVTPCGFIELWLEMKEKEIETRQGNGIIPGQLYDIVLVCVKERQLEMALDVATKIKPAYVERTSALCDAATILLMNGQAEDAKPFVLAANASLKSFSIDKYTNRTFLYSPFMAMELALGNEEKAKSFEEKAREEIDSENNSGEKYRCLARSFFLAEQFTSSIQVLDEGRRKNMNYDRIVSIFLANSKVDNCVLVELVQAIVKKATSTDSGRFSPSQKIGMVISQCFGESDKYEKALELMKDHEKLFQSISTVQPEIDVIRRLKAAKKDEKAIDALDERIKRCRPYKSSLNSWVRALVELQLDSKYELLDELLVEMEEAIPAELNSRYTGPERFIRDLSWIEGRLGREEHYITVLERSVTRQNFQLLAYLDLLIGSKNQKSREIVYAKLKELIEGKPETVDTFITLAQASRAMDNQSSMENYFEKAAALASKSDDPREQLQRVMICQIQVEDLAGAYQTWRRVVPGDRAYVGREFLKALIEAKHYSGVMQFIEQLPSKENKTIAAFTAIRLSYNRTDDDVHSWR